MFKTYSTLFNRSRAYVTYRMQPCIDKNCERPQNQPFLLIGCSVSGSVVLPNELVLLCRRCNIVVDDEC